MGETQYAHIPYPEPSAFVAQGANAMRSMAEAIDPRWAGGSLVRRADMSVATATTTPIQWSGAINAPTVGGAATTAADGVTVPVGLYLVLGTAHWNSNATGNRTLQVIANGAVVTDDASDLRPSAGASVRTVNQLSRVYRITAATAFNLQVNQTSGVTLAMIYARLDVYRIA